jgi:hypothetical protein
VKQSCKNCTTNFEIDQQDQDFYKKIDVPHPTHCPFCRQNRKLALRNERFLHHSSCDLCDKKMLSMIPPETDYTVYCNACWRSDKWNPQDYGRPYDPHRSFFEQFNELQNEVPSFALHQDKDSTNCNYVNYGIANKNCYLAMCAFSEDIYYSHTVVKSKNCMDCTRITECELCYSCLDCRGSYNLLFSQDCQNCSDSAFLKDCVSCKDCLLCAGLRNKQFCYMNEQLTKAEYQEKRGKMELSNQAIRDLKVTLNEASKKVPKKYFHGINCENFSGDYIENSRNLKECFDCLDGVENLAYCQVCGMKCFDCYDTSNAGLGTELCYEAHGIVSCNNCKFIYSGRDLQDSDYSQFCTSSDHLFGCIGLTHKSYHILNKEYSPEEYKALKAKIIANMKRDAEYGEFFPLKYSKFPYNHTLAFEYDPITQDQAKEKGFKWKDVDPSEDPVATTAKDSICCSNCSRHYKTISQELDFYKKFDLPIPDICHECRHKERFSNRNAPHLYDRQCDRCHSDIKTSYSKEQPEIIYCEGCYLKELA